MENKIPTYANGFSLAVNKEAGETVIYFVQAQPAFDSKDEQDILSPQRVLVQTMIIPYRLAEELHGALGECIERENSAHTKE